MQRLLNRNWITLTLFIVGVISFGFISGDDKEIHWVNFDEAVKLNEKHPRKILIDVYTQWCGWCKKMDASTYTDPDI
ncbi:MAG TPA: DUF255 domain-containing protein, partial [Bacteroidia bacterium]|nr:DUF255 domain-containing protein [Bacteroidia bacterium]